MVLLKYLKIWLDTDLKIILLDCQNTLKKTFVRRSSFDRVAHLYLLCFHIPVYILLSLAEVLFFATNSL